MSEKGDRVRLLLDYVDEQGNTFAAGQVGTVTGLNVGFVMVDFDGYAEDRAAADRFEGKYAAHPRIVPWLGVIPCALIEAAA